MIGLTGDEQRAMDLTADLMGLLAQKIIADGPTRAQDLSEAALRIHSIQHMIMSQAAARAHPDRYRLLGVSVLGAGSWKQSDTGEVS